MRARGIFFFGKILENNIANRAFGTGSENAQVLGEGFDVPVILSSVELKRFSGELAHLPILIERVLQKVFLCNRGVNFLQECGALHSSIPSGSVLCGMT